MSSRYEALTVRIDEFHEAIRQRFPESLLCGPGCSQCCRAELSVLLFEFRRVARAVLALPESDREALARRLARPPEDGHCVLLDQSGRCCVYPARPVICRSHGLPIRVGDPPRRDVCPLNFVDPPRLEELPLDALLDVNRINSILALIDRLEEQADGMRVPLREGLAELLGVTGGGG